MKLIVPNPLDALDAVLDRNVETLRRAVFERQRLATHRVAKQSVCGCRALSMISFFNELSSLPRACPFLSYAALRSGDMFINGWGQRMGDR